MTLAQFFFGYFAVMLIGLSILVITRKNPVHSVMLMLILFVHIAGIFLFLNADFLAAIQIIVYAGAVLVLFLFVIMLLNLKKEQAEKPFQKLWPAALAVAAGIAVFLVVILSRFSVFPEPGIYNVDKIRTEGVMMTTGKVLYTQYLLPFEIASLILLVAIIGAVVLTKRRLR